MCLVIGKAAMVTSRFVYRMYSMTLSIGHDVQVTEKAALPSRVVYRMYFMTLSIGHGVPSKAAMYIKICVQNVLYDTYYWPQCAW